ncbi:hypothetical protein BT69DRAFT_1329306 [Atractiella rhizophila]|nr:hypothetical protein BT69DRAFT_1329306 [Atractiella rhizophila]
MSLGNCFYAHGENKDALKAFEEAKIDIQCGWNEDALKVFEESKVLYMEMGDRMGPANCVHDIGKIDFRCRQNENALKVFEEAKVLYTEGNGGKWILTAEISGDGDVTGWILDPEMVLSFTRMTDRADKEVEKRRHPMEKGREFPGVLYGSWISRRSKLE